VGLGRTQQAKLARLASAYGGACSGEVFTGGRYNPTTNSWTNTLIAGAPSSRSVFPAVWTGSQMIVWGGFDDVNSTYTFTGGVYTPGP
jgi:hypothetical protein